MATEQMTLEQLTKNIERLSALQGKRKYISSVFEQHPKITREVMEGCLAKYLEEMRDRTSFIYETDISSSDGTWPPEECANEARRRIEKIGVEAGRFLEKIGMKYDSEYALRMAFNCLRDTGNTTTMRNIAERLGDKELLEELGSQPKTGLVDRYYQQEADRESDRMNLGANLAAFMQREAEEKRNYPALIKEAARLEEQGNYLEAAKAYERASSTDDRTENHLKAGMNYHKAGDTEKAQENLCSARNKKALEFCLEQGLEETALKMAERDYGLLKNIAAHYESAGRTADAKRCTKSYLKQAIEAERCSQFRNKEQLAKLYEQAGDLRNAAEWYQSEAGERVYSGELNEKGRQLAEKALNLYKRVSDYKGAAECYELIGNFEMSLKMLDRAEHQRK